MTVVNENIKEKFNELQELVDSIAYELDDAPSELTSIDVWKKTVIDSIPLGCSVKFRMDVEEMLENFKSIY